MRCFVAVPLPDNVRAAVTSAQSLLKQSQADIRWVAPACLHLTIQFLGDIGENILPALKDALAGIAGKHAPLCVSLGIIGAFPSLKAPRVLWQGINDQAMRVSTLIRECSQAMEAFGIRREEQTVHPHITLGRVRSQKNRNRLEREIEAWTKAHPRSTVAFTIDVLTLYKSDLTAQGPLYTPLYRANFAIT